MSELERPQNQPDLPNLIRPRRLKLGFRLKRILADQNPRTQLPKTRAAFQNRVRSFWGACSTPGSKRDHAEPGENNG